MLDSIRVVISGIKIMRDMIGQESVMDYAGLDRIRTSWTRII